jgi:elongation factor P hydroxylase
VSMKLGMVFFASLRRRTSTFSTYEAVEVVPEWISWILPTIRMFAFGAIADSTSLTNRRVRFHAEM